MKNKILFILIISSLLTIPFVKVSSQGSCSKTGYTILAINGIRTDIDRAIDNRDELQRDIGKNYNNELINVDYVYNPTHIAGIKDIADVVAQGLFEKKSDYDLTEMLQSASKKVTTEKLLLVGHSQGNFYANDFYDKVADVEGGVPKESIGVYSVATPDSRIAGDGKYLTSNTDKVIAGLVGTAVPILKPNTHIKYTNKDDFWGHDFLKVYLAYQGDKIVSDIKESLDKLKTNNIQDYQTTCLLPQKISLGHKITGVVLAVADFTADGLFKIGTTISDSTQKIGSDLGKKLANIAGRNPATVALPTLEEQSTTSLEVAQDSGSDNTQVDDTQSTISPTEVVQPKINPIKEKVIEKVDAPSAIPNTNPIVAKVTPKVLPVVSGFYIPSPEKSSTSNEEGSGSSGSDNNPSDNPPLPEPKDTTPLVVTLNGLGEFNIYVGETYTEEGAAAQDVTGGTVAVVITGNVDNSKIGTNILTYTATDKAGNSSSKNRTVHVVNPPPAPDTEAPVITLIGESNITIDLNSTYEDEGATALDVVDGSVSVNTGGSVDTGIAGTYTLTYTATDKAGNTSTLTRTVNVVIPTTYLSLPTAGSQKDIGIDKTSAKKNLESFYFQVAYTDTNNTAPQNIYVKTKNLNTGTTSDIYMYWGGAFTTQNEWKDHDYRNGEVYGNFGVFSGEGEYSYYFYTKNKDGKDIQVGQGKNLKFTVLPSATKYVSKYSFGSGNGDGHDWQVWIFEGSNIYNWVDSYVGNYLREQFTIQTWGPSYWCTDCLQRGIFKKDPKLGFELDEVTTSSLENTPQSNKDNKIYNVDIQWDETGYTYTITNDSVIYKTGHTNVPGMNNNLWVGWDGSHNNFTNFPKGNWIGDPAFFPEGRQGGASMVLEPYPVYQ